MKGIKLLVTSDIHGFVSPTDYTYQNNQNVGLANLATSIATLRDENTLLIDNGDIISGSPLAYYCNRFYEKDIDPLVETVNYLDYDYLNLGNHDFNFGKETLMKYLNNTQAKILTRNIKIDQNRIAPKYYVHEFKNGMCIAIFGIVTDFVKTLEKPENIEGIEFKDAFKTAKKCVKAILKNEHVDYIVGVYHGGFERDLKSHKRVDKQKGENVGVKILDKIPGLDVLITGHQHQPIATFYRNKIITQTSCNGQNLALIELYEDESYNYPTLIFNKYHPDNKMLDIVSDAEKQLQEFLNTKLADLSNDLVIEDSFQARLHKHPLVSFINQVQLASSQADLSGVALFNNVVGYKKAIKVLDVLANYPYFNYLKVIKIDGQTLKLYLEKNAEYFSLKNESVVVSKNYCYPKQKDYDYDMVDGINYTIDVSRPIGNRIVSLTYHGEKVAANDQFKLVISDYRYSGVGGFQMLADCELLATIKADMAQLIIKYLQDNPKLVINHQDNIQVINKKLG